MPRYCASCGTEVDETAIFCPTCGQPIDQAAETEMPPAPGWPDAPARPSPAEEAEPENEPGWEASPPLADEPTRVEARPEPPSRVPAVPPAEPARRKTASLNLPVTMPVTLSGWLIGGGAAFAALGVLIGLFGAVLNPVDLILLLLLIAIAATVFFSSSLPSFEHLRLATLAIVLIGFGVALDRLSLGAGGVDELLLFLGTAAAAIGVVLVELGHDQPLGGPGA